MVCRYQSGQPTPARRWCWASDLTPTLSCQPVKAPQPKTCRELRIKIQYLLSDITYYRNSTIGNHLAVVISCWQASGHTEDFIPLSHNAKIPLFSTNTLNPDYPVHKVFWPINPQCLVTNPKSSFACSKIRTKHKMQVLWFSLCWAPLVNFVADSFLEGQQVVPPVCREDLHSHGLQGGDTKYNQ